MKIKLEMTESDIIRAMKNAQHSPIQFLAAKHFKEDVKNIEVTNDSIVIWDDFINDYNSYRYCTEDINTIVGFIDEWAEYADGHLVDFALEPISFCVEQNR
jgi:hypothetical protein